jgi:tetratricopeptide (TPR) repeat protein
VAAGTVYFTTSDGLLHAVDAATGQKRWAVKHPVWGPSAPAVGEGVVCAGGRGESLVAYAVAGGTELWRFSAAGWFATPPVIGAGRVYALCWDDHLYVLNAHTGRLLWKYRGERGKGLTTPPAVAGGRIFAGSRVYRQTEVEQTGGYAMLALSAEDGSEVWRFYTERHIFTPPAEAGDALFFGSNDGLFYALDAASGEEYWRMQVKSRAVTQARVAGDVVCFGGRDGIIHAVRWRARPREELLSPSAYEQQGRYTEAAVAYALRGEFDRAADLYETRLGKKQEAAWLYERAGQPGKAAPLWEGLGELNRARDLYREAGDKLGLAGVLERTGELLQAARLYEEIENLEEAARLYEQAGDRIRAADLYMQSGQSERAERIWKTLDQWEKLVELRQAQKKHGEAAQILEQHAQLERAADLYEQAEQLEKALALRVRMEQWERVAELAFRVGDYEQEAQAQERLGHPQRAAEAYERAAQQLTSAEPVDEEYVAALYERATRLYADIYRERESVDCRRQVRRYRQLPEVIVSGKAQETFIENEWNVLDLQVQNVGFGIACNIRIALSENFQTRREKTVIGLPAAEQRSLEVHARPREGEYGARVPLDIVVTYEDTRGQRYQVTQVESVCVVRQGSGILGRATPLEVHIHGDLVEPGAKKVAGHEVQAGGQVGDKVEIRRGGGSGLTLESGETGARVRIRRNGKPVRRCPDCNLPINDPEQQYCSDCGAPLDDDRNH